MIRGKHPRAQCSCEKVVFDVSRDNALDTFSSSTSCKSIITNSYQQQPIIPRLECCFKTVMISLDEWYTLLLNKEERRLPMNLFFQISFGKLLLLIVSCERGAGGLVD